MSEMEQLIDAVLPRVSEFVGWYESAGAAEPAHMPAPKSPCPICWRVIDNRMSAKWTNLMYPGARRSFFYAMHPVCADKPREHVDAAVLDWSERQ